MCSFAPLRAWPEQYEGAGAALFSRLRAALVLVLTALAGAGCGGNGGTDVVLPSLVITTVTSGVELDPDGYSFVIDGQAPQAIGLAATVTLERLADGQHTIELAGIAPNCTLEGDNPRTVVVTSGVTTRLTFTVTCSAPPPNTGTLEIRVVTTGPDQDPDGYQVSVDGGPGQPIGINATLSLANVSAAQHTVRLLGLADNCAVTGDNPLGAAVPAGGAASVSFAVTCVATLAELAITVSGLPGGVPAAVTVSGPENFREQVTQTRTLSQLIPGRYSVTASNVVSGGTTYTPSVGRPTVDMAAGASEAVTISYTAVARPTLNLRIDGLYLTQSTQTYGSTVALVAGRDAFLRVFVVANERNSARPRVRIQLSRSGAPAQTLTIEAPGASVPTRVQEGVLDSSWNVRLQGSSIQTGLTIVAEVDPGAAVPESNEGDNRFPASGSKAFTIRGVPPARIRFVSVQQGSSVPGNVSSQDRLIGLARRMYPLNAVEVDVHPVVFAASVPLEANGNGWSQVLSDLDALRVADGVDHTYFGIARLNYGRADGLVGLAFQQVPTALGWDDASDSPRVVAHELGHTWGRRHTSCGNPPAESVDQLYPYSNGRIGVHGLDLASSDPKPPSAPDIMGYCFDSPWTSDYTYQAVMTFRGSSGAGARLAGSPQPALLIRGRVESGRPVLEPAFHVVTRSSLPTRPGPYSITGTGATGSRLFSLSFDMAAAAHDPRNGGHFAFAVPLDERRRLQLEELVLSGPAGTASSSRQPRMSGDSESAVSATRDGQAVTLRWDAGVYPAIMVRDAETGAVLALARGGRARIWTGKAKLDLELSDGVGSRRVHLRVGDP